MAAFAFALNWVQHNGSRNSMILYFLNYFIFLAIPIYYFIVSAIPKIICYTDQKTMEGRVFFVGNIYTCFLSNYINPFVVCNVNFTLL
jgi:hypothetical protein